MDKIILNGLQFYGYHGVFPEETKLGQAFIVDIILESDLKMAGLTDDLEQSIHYGLVYEEVKEVVEGKPFQLIEALSEKIAFVLLTKFTRLNRVTVRVSKPNAPIKGVFSNVAIEITRDRNE